MGEFPREQSDKYDVTYGDVSSDGDRLRTIITKPKKKGKFPVVFYVQGVGCGSVDFSWSAALTLEMSQASGRG